MECHLVTKTHMFGLCTNDNLMPPLHDCCVLIVCFFLFSVSSQSRVQCEFDC